MPRQAAALRLAYATAGSPPFEIFSSSGLAAGTVVCIATAALASATGLAPRIDVSDQAVLHMEDTTPVEIGSAGVPPTIAAPVRSTYQTDCVALRVSLEASWALLDAGGIAWLDGSATW